MKCYFDPPDGDEPSDWPDLDDDDSGAGTTSLSPALLARHGARVLDPTAVPTAEGWPAPRQTVYRTRTLLMPPHLQHNPFLPALNAVLSRAGMRLEPVTGHGKDDDDGRLAGIPVTAVLTEAPSHADGQPPVVDAWTAARGGQPRRGGQAQGRVVRPHRRHPDRT
jgi:hypothetical protein